MSLRERRAETKALPSKKKLLQLFFTWGLAVSYAFVENSVTSRLVDYLTRPDESPQIAAIIITNLQDALSSISVIIVYLISEVYTGCFTMITFCSSASIMGLMLLWISSISTSDYDMIFVAISFITLGSSGQRMSRDFFDYHLKGEVRAGKEGKPGFSCRIIFWNFFVSCLGYAISVVTCMYVSHKLPTKLGPLLMGASYLLFYFGYGWYNHESLPAESNLGRIHRICKAAYRKRKFAYPTSEDGYYWKNYKRSHFYKAKDAQVLRLLPRVPCLFRWLDRAAIVNKGQKQTSRQDAQKKGEPYCCTVKEVREVKSLALLLCWCFTLLGYTLAVASENTFFVVQANSLKPVFSCSDIPILFVLKSVMSYMPQFFIRLIRNAFERTGEGRMSKIKRTNVAVIRIGMGLVCSLGCCVLAWHVEVRRLRLIKNGGHVSMRTKALVPQFALVGMAEGLVEDGMKELYTGYASQSMRTFEEPFTPLVIGVGKLFSIPCVLLFKGCFKEETEPNNSYLGRYLETYYAMLAVLNFGFLFAFALFYFRYAYNNEFPKDEEIVVAHQADTEDANAKEPRVSHGDSGQERNDEIELAVQSPKE